MMASEGQVATEAGSNVTATLQTLRLEDLADRQSLQELAQSFLKLFGVPMRIFSQSGALLADTSFDQDLCQAIRESPNGRGACTQMVQSVKAADPASPRQSMPCFSGATYEVVAIEIDQQRLGRAIIGPMVTGPVDGAPDSLRKVSPDLLGHRALPLLRQLPSTQSPEQLDAMVEHLRKVLDMVLYAGYKSHVTSEMHLASVHESYRELEQKNKRLQDAVDKLRELDRLKSNFLATVSHELRTPLTSIIGYSEMLVEGIAGDLEGEQLEFVKTIHEKGEQLLALIMNLLDLSKLESGTMSLKRGQVGIDQVVAQVISTLLPTARKKGVKLESQIAKGLPALNADGEKLRQVFLNLTENAIKFTPAGGTITLSAKAIQASPDGDAGFVLFAPTLDEVEIRVADTGVGIAEKERERIFQAFYQVDSSSTREYGGTGLGLSIVKRLVESHDGKLRVEGNEPTGTVFVVTLPLPS